MNNLIPSTRSRIQFALLTLATALSFDTQAMAAVTGADCEARVVANNQIEAQGAFEATIGGVGCSWCTKSGYGNTMVGKYRASVILENTGETQLYVYRQLSLLERFANELAPVGGGGGASFTHIKNYDSVIDQQNDFALLTAVDHEKSKTVQVKCVLRKP